MLCSDLLGLLNNFPFVLVKIVCFYDEDNVLICFSWICINVYLVII